MCQKTMPTWIDRGYAVSAARCYRIALVNRGALFLWSDYRPFVACQRPACLSTLKNQDLPYGSDEAKVGGCVVDSGTFCLRPREL